MWLRSLANTCRGRQSSPWRVSIKAGLNIWMLSAKLVVWSKHPPTAYQIIWPVPALHSLLNHQVKSNWQVVSINSKLKNTLMVAVSFPSNRYPTWIWNLSAHPLDKSFTRRVWLDMSQSTWFRSLIQPHLKLTLCSGQSTLIVIWQTMRLLAVSSTFWWRAQLIHSLANILLIILPKR